MKKKKNIYIIAIVALILVLGVGYAVVSNRTLTIDGSGTAATEEIKVVYDGTTASSGANVTAITAANNTKAASFTIENMVLNTPEYAEFEIINRETDVNASIAVPSLSWTNTSYFDTKIYYKGSGDADFAEWTSGTKTLAVGATARIKVVVTMTSTPISAANSTTEVTVSYVASPASGS